MENIFVNFSSSSDPLVEKDLINCLERKYWVGGLDLTLSLHAPIKTCAHCRATKTPLWRKGPDGPKTLCNACGLRHRKNEMQLKTILTLSPPDPIARVIRRRHCGRHN